MCFLEEILGINLFFSLKYLELMDRYFAYRQQQKRSYSTLKSINLPCLKNKTYEQISENKTNVSSNVYFCCYNEKLN